MSKPPLVMISGWAHTADVLRPLADLLAGDFDVLRFSTRDLAARGATYADGLQAALRALSSPAVVLGWSMGGLIAIETAARDPGLFAGLILVASTPRFCSDEDFPQGTPEKNVRALAAALRRHPESVWPGFFREVAAPHEPDARSLRAGIEAASMIGTEALCADLAYLRETDLRRTAASLQVPLLAVHGREDRIIPWQAGQWFAGQRAAREAVIVDGEGHDLPVRHPGIVSQEARRFFGSLRSGPHSRSVGRRFSSAAGTYDDHAGVQNAAAAKLIRLLPPSGSVRRILEVGCGTGALTRHLLGGFPAATMDAVDLSPRMVEAASRRFAAAPTIRWEAADIRHYRGHGRYDLAASNCALHWVDPLIEGFQNLARLLAEDGELVFSIMLHGTLGELHEARLRAAPDKPPLGRLPRFNEVADSLDLCGFAIQDSCEETIAETYPSADAFLRAIHRLGLTGGNVSRSSSPLTRGQIGRLAADYEARYRDPDGRVRASYSVGYVRARKR